MLTVIPMLVEPLEPVAGAAAADVEGSLSEFEDA